MLREEFRQRLAKEYHYAATKMQEAPQPAKKLYYFSILFGEAQRVLNWEWSTDLALIYAVAQHVYTQVSMPLQVPPMGQTLPIDWTVLCDRLTQTTSDLAAYFEKAEDEGTTEELYRILGHFAEIAYAAGGNGSYLYEKGLIKF